MGITTFPMSYWDECHYHNIRFHYSNIIIAVEMNLIVLSTEEPQLCLGPTQTQ